jgi:hypothetical protein
MSSSLIDAVRLDPTCGITMPAHLSAEQQRDLLRALTAVPDPRRRRGVRYRLVSLLAVAVCAVLAGATTFAAIADWAADLDEPARHRLGLRGRIPVGSTVWRFLVRLDAQVLQAVLSGWLRHRLPPQTAEPTRRNRVVIAVDGKVLRGAKLPLGRHWVRDMTLGEDAHQARTGNGPAVAAVLRNTAIGYHRSNGEPNIARATRRANRRPHDLINAVTSATRTQ